MSIVLIGGMDRLAPHYQNEARKLDCQLHIFTRSTAKMTTKIRSSDALILFTNKVSHQARNEAVSVAQKHDVPIYMYHSCGLCTLRDCLQCLLRAHQSPSALQQ